MRRRITIGAGCVVAVGIVAYLVYAKSIAPPAPPAQLLPKHGDLITNSIGMKLVYVGPGEFTMGSPSGEQDRDGNEGQHRVKLTNSFYLGVYEVTQAQWKAVMGSNPSQFKGDDLPVEMVSWNEAVEFCRKLSEREGKEYCLPTESEWEYACRAGTTTPYGGTGRMDDMGWYGSNSDGKTHPVGQKKPNAWGLHDMHGNVWEWCSDWYGNYPTGSVMDPVGPTSGSVRVDRGGSWMESPRDCRSARRGRPLAGYRGILLGFRVVLRSRGPVR